MFISTEDPKFASLNTCTFAACDPSISPLKRKKIFDGASFSTDSAGPIPIEQTQELLLAGGSFINRHSVYIPIATRICPKKIVSKCHVALEVSKFGNEIILIAYPQAKDMNSYQLASGVSSVEGGPGCDYPGSIGALSIAYLEQYTGLHLQWMQGSVNFKSKEALGHVSAKLSRTYAGWRTTLMDNFFQFAKSQGVKEVLCSRALNPQDIQKFKESAKNFPSIRFSVAEYGSYDPSHLTF